MLDHFTGNQSRTTVIESTQRPAAPSKLSSKQPAKRLRIDPLNFDRPVLIFSFLLSLSLSLSLSLLPLWYLCVGSCRGDKTHKHCGGRQEVLRNHNGVTAALRSLSSALSLCLPQPARMLLSLASCTETTPLSAFHSVLSFLSLLLALLFQLCPSLFSSTFSTTLAALVFGKSLSDLRCLECLVRVDVLKSCRALSVFKWSTCPQGVHC